MILLLDDERASVEPLLDELEHRRLPVRFCETIAEAKEVLNGAAGQIGLAIIDVMVPPGDSYDMEGSEEGLLTGALFFRELRSAIPECPVILLTNRTAPLPEDVRRDKGTTFIVKTDVYYDDLADLVQRLYTPTR